MFSEYRGQGEEVLFSSNGSISHYAVLYQAPDCLCRCYISYSRFTPASKVIASQLYDLLTKSRIRAVLDSKLPYSAEGDGVGFIENEIQDAQFVLILLDKDHLWNVSSASAVFDDMDIDMARTIREMNILRPIASSLYPAKDLVPVAICAAADLDSLIPIAFKERTVHRLPLDYDESSAGFQGLLRTLKAGPAFGTAIASDV